MATNPGADLHPPPFLPIQYAVWLTATRTLKLLPHLWYRPQDIIYVPAWIAFGYYLSVARVLPNLNAARAAD